MTSDPGSNGDVICTLPVGSFVNATCTLTPSQMTSLTSGGVYFNIHTSQNGGGMGVGDRGSVGCEGLGAG